MHANFPQGLRVLLLDGSPLHRAQAAEQLRQCAYTVTVCSTPTEAVSLLLQGGGVHKGSLAAGKSLQRGSALAQESRVECPGGSPKNPAPPPFDVLLVEARLLLPDGNLPGRSKLVKLCRTLPFILMSSSPNPTEVGAPLAGLSTPAD